MKAVRRMSAMKPVRRMRLRTYAATMGLLTLGAVSVQIASCTVFNGLEVASDTVDGASGFDAAEGGGADADAAPVDPCVGSNDGYLSRTEAAKACRWMFKCPLLELNLESSLGLIGSDTNFALCMNWLAGPVPPTRVGRDIQQASLKCIARATTCGEASACLAVEGFYNDDPRCDAGADSAFLLADHCEGTSGIDCTDGVAFHCGAASYGGTAQCLVDEGGVVGCGQLDPAGTCPFRVTACDPVTGNFSDCSQGTQIDVSFSCQAVGSVCGDAGPEAGHKFDCLTNGSYQKCNVALFVNKCVGDLVETCNGNGTVSQLDCAAIGRHCSQAEGKPLCITSTDSCSPFSLGQNQCMGSTISSCIAGKKVQFDCACGGMTCVTDDGSIPLAHCE